MFGLNLWFFSALLLSATVIIGVLVLSSNRPWIQRALLVLGGLSAVWGFIPRGNTVGEFPILVLASIIALGTIAICDKINMT
ncbi:MAG: hypothetical protein DRI65_04225 [Chloroflexota bacterium]|nr:MAG: hypothetical protein DRI65_04225 [Chloroflexota bacterium]